MTIDHLGSLLQQCATPETHFPPTDLYCEGWMLRLVLDWTHKSGRADLSIPHTADSSWYSEARLISPFRKRANGDPLAEGPTRADSVIGQFSIGDRNKGDFALEPNSSCFAVLEAKIYSELTKDVTNADYYNQAARNVACMAEAINQAKANLEQFDVLAFIVIAPQSQIEAGKFSEFMARQSIIDVVCRRVGEYGGEKNEWYESRFLPMAEKIDLRMISWEEAIADIQQHDPDFGAELSEFYANCLRFNGPSR